MERYLITSFLSALSLFSTALSAIQKGSTDVGTFLESLQILAAKKEVEISISLFPSHVGWSAPPRAMLYREPTEHKLQPPLN